MKSLMVFIKFGYNRYITLDNMQFIVTARRYRPMLARYTRMLSLCVCPSVCLKSKYYEVAEPRMTQTTPYDGPGILVY